MCVRERERKGSLFVSDKESVKLKNDERITFVSHSMYMYMYVYTLVYMT